VIHNLADFYLGVLTGVAGLGIFVGFAAALVTFVGADSDKRGLSGRHRPGALAVGELPVPHLATLPVSAPYQGSMVPGSSTVAGFVTPPRPKKASTRSRPSSPHAKQDIPEPAKN